MDEQPTARPPRSEPEILPPGSDPGAGRRESRFIFIDARSGRAIPLVRPSLFTMLVIAGLVGLVVTALVVLALGAFLISLPLLGLLFAGLLLGSLLRPRRPTPR